jgi:hypothetical protein
VRRIPLTNDKKYELKMVELAIGNESLKVGVSRVSE